MRNIQFNFRFLFFFLQILIKSFKHHEIDECIIVFGATPYTAKEAYVIMLPTISKKHLAENHLTTMRQTTQKVLL